MLVHITATHTAADCPLYNPAMREMEAQVVPAFEKQAAELGVKIHFTLSAGPSHVMYFLLEAEHFSSIQALLESIPMRQDFTITPVADVREVVGRLAQQPAGAAAAPRNGPAVRA